MKGMSLEELRKGLESDAKTENEQLKKRIAELEKEHNKSVLLEDDLRAMCNRCYVCSRGMMCLHCQLKSNFKCDYK